MYSCVINLKNCSGIYYRWCFTKYLLFSYTFNKTPLIRLQWSITLVVYEYLVLFQQWHPYTTASTQVKCRPANLVGFQFSGTQFVTWTNHPPKNRSYLLFLNWHEGHCTTLLKINSVARQNNFPNKCPLHDVAGHAYGTCTYTGSYMHPVHDKQETSLNARGGGGSQTWEDRRFLDVQIVQIKKALS